VIIAHIRGHLLTFGLTSDDRSRKVDPRNEAKVSTVMTHEKALSNHDLDYLSNGLSEFRKLDRSAPPVGQSRAKRDAADHVTLAVINSTANGCCHASFNVQFPSFTAAIRTSELGKVGGTV
jgi:hypothetical protein